MKPDCLIPKHCAHATHNFHFGDSALSSSLCDSVPDSKTRSSAPSSSLLLFQAVISEVPGSVGIGGCEGAGCGKTYAKGMVSIIRFNHSRGYLHLKDKTSGGGSLDVNLG